MKYSKVKTEDRRKRILDAAITLAKTKGLKSITRDGVANAAEMSYGSINLAFGTIDSLREELMKEAIQRGVLEIVAEGLGNKDPVAMCAPSRIKQQAITFMLAGN